MTFLKYTSRILQSVRGICKGS